MRDSITEELLSAYVDDELGGEDRQRVERALAESAEHRQLLEELRRMRSTFEQFPRYRIPPDFHERVLRRVEEAREPVRRSAEVTPASISHWSKLVAPIVAVAGLLLLAFMSGRRIVPDQPDIETLSGSKQPDQGPPVPGLKEFDEVVEYPELEETFVHYSPRGSRLPTYSLVVDVTVTPQGRVIRAFEDVLRQNGIPIDPDLAVDDELEETIFASRFGANVEAGNRQDAKDDVQMMYVVCEPQRMDDVYATLRKRKDEFRVMLDLVLNPEEVSVMHQLNGSSRQHFASLPQMDTRRTLAHRLVFRVALNSSARLLGTIPTPSVRAELLPAEEAAGRFSLPAFGLAPVEPAVPQLNNAPVAGEPAAAARQAPAEAKRTAARRNANAEATARSEILFVVRYLKQPLGIGGAAEPGK